MLVRNATSARTHVIATHVEDRDGACGRMKHASNLRQDDWQVGERLRAGRHDHANAVRLHQRRGFAAAEVGIDDVEIGDLDVGATPGEA